MEGRGCPRVAIWRELGAPPCVENGGLKMRKNRMEDGSLGEKKNEKRGINGQAADVEMEGLRMEAVGKLCELPLLDCVPFDLPAPLLRALCAYWPPASASRAKLLSRLLAPATVRRRKSGQLFLFIDLFIKHGRALWG